MTICRAWSTPATNGSSSAPAFASGASPPTARPPATLQPMPRRGSRPRRQAAADIDLIVLATSTPDNTFPATAAKVQAALGITRGSAFDIQAVCSGFVYGLTVADSLIKTGQSNCALVIGAETFSRILDWQIARPACSLATAPARWSSKGQESAGGKRHARRHRLAPAFRWPLLRQALCRWRASTTMTVGHVRMEGREVFKHAVVNIAA